MGDIDEAVKETVEEAVEEAAEEAAEEVAEETAEEVAEEVKEETADNGSVSVAGEVNESLELGERYRAIARDEALQVAIELEALKEPEAPVIVVAPAPEPEPEPVPINGESEEGFEPDDEPRRENWWFKNWGRRG